VGPPRYLHQPATELGLACARQDATIVLEDLLLYDAQLRCQHLEAEPRIGRYALIGRISDYVEELLDAVSTNRRRKPELGQVRPHRVRQLRALTV
jgi:hypothetical protein